MVTIRFPHLQKFSAFFSVTNGHDNMADVGEVSQFYIFPTGGFSECVVERHHIIVVHSLYPIYPHTL